MILWTTADYNLCFHQENCNHFILKGHLKTSSRLVERFHYSNLWSLSKIWQKMNEIVKKTNEIVKL